MSLVRSVKWSATWRFPGFLLALVVTSSFALADPEAAGRDSESGHVRAELIFEGAAAEDIAELIPRLGIKSAVINDGSAILYFEQSLDEVKGDLEKIDPLLPEGCKFEGMEKVEGGIPSLPKPVGQPKVDIRFDSDRLRALGLTLVDAGKQLREQFSADKEQTDMEEIEMTNLELPGGAKVLLKDVAEIRLIEVMRPLIIDGRDIRR